MSASYFIAVLVAGIIGAAAVLWFLGSTFASSSRAGSSQVDSAMEEFADELNAPDVGTGQNEGYVDPAPMPLPADIPHRKWLEKGGVVTFGGLYGTDDLTEIKHIGETRAANIRSWLEERREENVGGDLVTS
jgi:hypothetical protein